MTTAFTRDQLNALLGMTEEELDQEAERLENENIPDGYTGEVIYGVPWEESKPTHVHTVRLDDFQSESVKRIAKASSHTVSEVLRKAVDFYLVSIRTPSTHPTTM